MDMNCYTIQLQSAPEETAKIYLETPEPPEQIEKAIQRVNEEDIYFHELLERVRDISYVEKVVRVDEEDFTVEVK